MAHLFEDSFDTYNTAGVITQYASVAGSYAIVANGRTGVNALNFTTATGGLSYVLLPNILETLPCTIILGMALYIPSGFFTNSGQSIAPINFGTGQWGTTLGGLKCLIFGDGSMQNQFTGGIAGSGTWGFGAYHYLEFQAIVGASTVEATCWVDDNQVFDATASYTSWSTLTAIQIGIPVVNASSGNPSGTVQVDDVYCNDGSTLFCNSRFGDCDVYAQVPAGPGRITGVWSNNGGGGSQNWQNCNAIPATPSDYITDSTAGDEEDFILTAGPATGADILAQQVTLTAAKNTPSGTRQIAGGLGNGSAEGFGTPATLTTTFKRYQFPFSNDPVSGGAFDPTITYQAAVETIT